MKRATPQTRDLQFQVVDSPEELDLDRCADLFIRVMLEAEGIDLQGDPIEQHCTGQGPAGE